jgi:hypothetical protein
MVGLQYCEYPHRVLSSHPAYFGLGLVSLVISAFIRGAIYKTPGVQESSVKLRVSLRKEECARNLTTQV